MSKVIRGFVLLIGMAYLIVVITIARVKMSAFFFVADIKNKLYKLSIRFEFARIARWLLYGNDHIDMEYQWCKIWSEIEEARISRMSLTELTAMRDQVFDIECDRWECGYEMAHSGSGEYTMEEIDEHYKEFKKIVEHRQLIELKMELASSN